VDVTVVTQNVQNSLGEADQHETLAPEWDLNAPVGDEQSARAVTAGVHDRPDCFELERTDSHRDVRLACRAQS
jgi:hypothetical protein